MITWNKEVHELLYIRGWKKKKLLDQIVALSFLMCSSFSFYFLIWLKLLGNVFYCKTFSHADSLKAMCCQIHALTSFPQNSPPPENSSLCKSQCNQNLTSVLLTSSPSTIRKEINWKLFIVDEQWIAKAVLLLAHFILKMDTEELRQITQLFLFSVHYKSIQWNYFPLPTIGSNDERWEEYPVKLLSKQFQLLAG